MIARLFKLFRKKINKKQIEKSVQDFESLWNAELDAIWSITDKNQFLSAMNGWLCRKCNYGENVEKLSDAEKIFYYNTQFESEVNNGGLSQFFYNNSGNFANELCNSLSAVGAFQTEKIYNKALSTLGCKLPKNQIDREELLDKILTDAANELLNECDVEFYKYPDNLNELNYQYIIKNKVQFT